jgi:hypothetical protein
MMEEVRTSETSVYSNATTRRYIPECCKLHTARRENLKYGIQIFPIALCIVEAVVKADARLH